MEIVGTISVLLSCACQPACQLICEQLNYIRKVKENEQIMWRELDSLRTQERDIGGKLNTGKVQYGKRPKEEVTNWLKNLEEIENIVESLGSSDAHHTCFKGFCPNYYFHLKRSKKIVKIIRRVKALQEKGNSFAQSENIFIDSLPETSSSLPATNLYGSSFERKKDEILQCIMDREVSKIGVYGMGGVGKTTIMTQIYNQLKKMQDFEIIIWVTVSSSLDLEKLQNKIAELLGCQLSSFAEETSRALVLHEAFKRRRNFVIILDDIWDKVSLKNVGIPEPNRTNGSKVVWTTRFIKVCNSMESQREIKVECLPDEEAWSLFKDKAGGEDVIVSPKIEPIARQVARECGGLPLALITVGCALRKEYKLPVWRNALQEFKTSSANPIDVMGTDVFGSLKLSYNRLSNDKIRECFLYCALYPEDANILVDELIEYWMAEGLIDEEGSTETEKDKGHAYLKELKDACMIESIEADNEYVRMHDVIRDLAINITREQPLFMVKAGLRLKESPKEEEWVESLERVSLMRNDIKAFQGQPNCPQLSTLLLDHGSCSVTFSDTFFRHMHNLRVLNLSETKIESLPDSLSDLMNLHALILTGCSRLKYLPSLANLQRLRQLKLGWLLSLKELPDGLEKLVKLRHVDISNGGWGRFPSGVLSKMSCLEILLMQSGRWRFSYGSNEDAEDNSTFGEIISLKNLTKFSADFTDVLTFNGYINKLDKSELLKNLDSFLFGVSHKYDGHNVGNENTERVILPGTTNFLGIDGCNFIQLSDIFGIDDLSKLMICSIENCNEIEWIAKDGEIVLPSLKVLALWDLHSLKGLCKEKAHEETFKNLRQLFITRCQKLKYLIPMDLLVNNLQNLEEIFVVSCYEMEGIISVKASAAMIILPKLKKLHLQGLPALTSICKGKLVCDSLCEITLVDCPKMGKLPFLINNMSTVAKKIIGSEKWWETLEWEDPHLKGLLQPCFVSEEMYRHIGTTSNRHRLVSRILDLWDEQMIKIGKIDFQSQEDWFPRLRVVVIPFYRVFKLDVAAVDQFSPQGHVKFSIC
ncbi:putative P-loop containing nucleoside triphosphate hydrolase, leucine-rich repeat domain superfamily [Dioscorea sansibarensis]